MIKIFGDKEPPATVTDKKFIVAREGAVNHCQVTGLEVFETFEEAENFIKSTLMIRERLLTERKLVILQKVGVSGEIAATVEVTRL